MRDAVDERRDELRRRVGRQIIDQPRRLHEKRGPVVRAIFEIREFEDLRFVTDGVRAVDVDVPLRARGERSEHARRRKKRQRERHDVALHRPRAYRLRKPVGFDELLVGVAAHASAPTDIRWRNDHRELFSDQEQPLQVRDENLVFHRDIVANVGEISYADRRTEALEIDRHDATVKADRIFLQFVIAGLRADVFAESVAEHRIDAPGKRELPVSPYGNAADRSTV